MHYVYLVTFLFANNKEDIDIFLLSKSAIASYLLLEDDNPLILKYWTTIFIARIILHNIIIIKIILKNIRVVKFSRLEVNPRKQQNYFTSKISQYMVISTVFFALYIAS